MSYCHVHGREYEYRDGCPECRDDREEAFESQEQARIETAERFADLERSIRNPGDYECPHCLYVSLKRDASRCPTCHANIDREHWVGIRKAELAAAESARHEAERSAA